MRLKLKGEVLCDEWAEIYRWFGYDTGFFSPSDVAEAIEGLADDEELVLEVNSVGGDVRAASEIYSALVLCRNPTRAIITGLAASAASYLVLGCDVVEIAQPAQMMIHLASWDIGGNKHDHEHTAQALDAEDVSILDTYAKKCGEEHREELMELMEAESYLPAGKCVELGLCDRILESEDEGEPLRMVASAGNCVYNAMRLLPDIRELKSRRQQEIVSKQQEEDDLLRAETKRYLI